MAKPGSGKYLAREPFGYSYERVPSLTQARDYKNFKVERGEAAAKKE